MANDITENGNNYSSSPRDGVRPISGRPKADIQQAQELPRTAVQLHLIFPSHSLPLRLARVHDPLGLTYFHYDPSSGGSLDFLLHRQSFLPLHRPSSPGAARYGPFVRNRPGKRPPSTSPWRLEGSGSDIYKPLRTPWGGFEVGNEVWGLVPDKRYGSEGSRLGKNPLARGASI